MNTMTIAALGLTLAVTGCALTGQSAQTEAMAAVRDTCGVIPARSRMKSSGDFRLRTYRACKAQILQQKSREAGDDCSAVQSSGRCCQSCLRKAN
jgi:hypothetical protein